MSHEVRTPLNGMLGMLSLLLATELDGEQRDYAETAYRAGEAVLGIVDDILDLSRIEAGKLDLEHVTFDVSLLVEEVARLSGASAVQKDVELACLVEPQVGTACGDPARLRQVLTNLVANAVKFTAVGEVVVRAARKGDMVRFEVADTGVGIDPHDADRLFDAFTQALPSTNRRYGGAGLGLAISKHLVERLGGRIGVESTPARGSRFWFEVPLPARAMDGPATSPRPTLVGLRVLVVDDNHIMRDILTRMTANWRMVPVAEGDGAAALVTARAAAARGAPFDVVLVDMDMPGMDGATLASAVRASVVPRPRVVLLTRSVEGGRGVAAAVGADGAVAKPVRASQLYDVLAGFFGDPGEETDSTPELQEPLERRHHDAILMDCQMPGVDGYEATRQIRRREGGRHRAPIVALTASAATADRERAPAAGMDEHVPKPVDRDRLAEVLAGLREGGVARPPTLDPEVVANLREVAGSHPREFWGELRELLAEDAATQVGSLRAALAAGRPDAIAATAHRLKGAGGYLGAATLVDVCTRLEALTTGADGVANEVAATVDELEHVLGQVLAAVEQEERRSDR